VPRVGEQRLAGACGKRLDEGDIGMQMASEALQ
jgi:hypothetical protein